LREGLRTISKIPKDSNADGAPDAVTKYAYDGDDILYEFDASNALTARHTHGPGVLMALCHIASHRIKGSIDA
jgi:hypothetical protein